MAIPAESGWGRLLATGVAVLGLASVVGCQQQAVQQAGPRPTPPPGFAAAQATAPQILGYGRGLDFDTVHGVGDEQRLMLYDAATKRRSYGPLARIEPERGELAVPRRDLGTGRILARLINEDSIPYPKLFMAPHDTVYWWVDSVRAGRFQSRLVSAKTGRDTVMAFTTRSHPGYVYLQAMARWIWSERDEWIWVPCGNPGECCWMEGPGG